MNRLSVNNDEARSARLRTGRSLTVPHRLKNGELNRICAMQRLPLLLPQYLLEYLLALP